MQTAVKPATRSKRTTAKRSAAIHETDNTADAISIAPASPAGHEDDEKLDAVAAPALASHTAAESDAAVGDTAITIESKLNERSISEVAGLPALDESNGAALSFPGEISPPFVDERVKHHALRIGNGWRKSTDGLLELASFCVEAIDEVREFRRATLVAMLPFGEAQFSKFLSIGRSGPLYNPEFQTELPPKLTVLYLLKDLKENELRAGISEGIVTPDAQRAVVERWIRDPANCAADRKTPSAQQNDAIQKGVLGLVKAWEASTDLQRLWKTASTTARKGFLRAITKSNSK